MPSRSFLLACKADLLGLSFDSVRGVLDFWQGVFAAAVRSVEPSLALAAFVGLCVLAHADCPSCNVTTYQARVCD